MSVLFDHLIGTGRQRWRKSDAQGSGRLHVEKQLDLRDLLHGQICGSLPFEDPSDIDARLTVRLREVASVAHQSTSHGKIAGLGDCRDGVALRESRKLMAAVCEIGVGGEYQPARPKLCHSSEYRLKLLFLAGI